MAYFRVLPRHAPAESTEPHAKPQSVRGCIQKFPDWPPGARTANGTALFH